MYILYLYLTPCTIVNIYQDQEGLTSINLYAKIVFSQGDDWKSLKNRMKTKAKQEKSRDDLKSTKTPGSESMISSSLDYANPYELEEASSSRLNSRKVVIQCNMPFCANGINCAHSNCQDCIFNCHRNAVPAFCTTKLYHIRCVPSCSPETCGGNNKNCAACIFCNDDPVSAECPLATFQDITDGMFLTSEEEEQYWYSWRHSGKPYNHFTSPIMVDLNNDGLLDYFNAMHNTADKVGKMELGLIQMTPNPQKPLVTNKISGQIILEDDLVEIYEFMDSHGGNVLDLDNDGILDIFIASGGNRGLPLSNGASRDNFLLFGEEATCSSTAIFRGGRMQAAESGVNMRMGRGKLMYMFDINNDGLIDMFPAQSRRVDNLVTPGTLLVNGGNRTWEEDDSLSEFASAMIITDADGDGVANEFMIIRDFCFPDRANPESDSRFGPFREAVKDFCSTRPVGTMAIYKYTPSLRKMKEISQKYSNIDSARSSQPECCPHGLFSGAADCSAMSIASADLDNDQRPDYAILYSQKVDFYFSSDRERGTLPIGNVNIGLTLALPPSCAKGQSIRFVDINNSGKVDLIVSCLNVDPILVYTQGLTKESWTLNNGCNGNGSLGDISYKMFEWSDKDIIDACDNADEWDQLATACDEYQAKSKKPSVKLMGLTLADFNNDGLPDFAISTSFGYQRFFLNKSLSNNDYVTFRIMGDGKEVNKYGIGATLILIYKDENKYRRHFREISSYQHSTDSHGSIDEKITFGLGKTRPWKLLVQWPNDRKQIVHLKRFKFSPSMEPIMVHYPLKDYENFWIQSAAFGQTLCMSTGPPGDQWDIIQMVECIADDGTEESPSSSQQFRWDTGGRLRNRNGNGFCATPRFKDNTMHMIDCTKKNAKRISWHLTRDGKSLRVSGSDHVLGVTDNVVGEKAKITLMKEGNEELQWNFLKSLD